MDIEKEENSLSLRYLFCWFGIIAIWLLISATPFLGGCTVLISLGINIEDHISPLFCFLLAFGLGGVMSALLLKGVNRDVSFGSWVNKSGGVGIAYALVAMCVTYLFDLIPFFRSAGSEPNTVPENIAWIGGLMISTVIVPFIAWRIYKGISPMKRILVRP